MKYSEEVKLNEAQRPRAAARKPGGEVHEHARYDDGLLVPDVDVLPELRVVHEPTQPHRAERAAPHRTAPDVRVGREREECGERDAEPVLRARAERGHRQHAVRFRAVEPEAAAARELDAGRKVPPVQAAVRGPVEHEREADERGPRAREVREAVVVRVAIVAKR